MNNGDKPNNCSVIRCTLVVLLVMQAPAIAQIAGLPTGVPDVQCPPVVAQARAAIVIDSLPPKTGTDSKAQTLQSLAVVITVSSDLLSGTSDDVWLDVGPRAWKLGSNFPTGSTQIFKVDVSNPDPAIDIPSLIPLTVADITELRIDKKGLCGLTNAPDSIAAMLLPDIPKPEDFINSAQKQLDLAKYLFERRQAALALAQQAVDKAAAALLDANNQLNAATNAISNIPGKIADTQNRIVDLQKQVLGVPKEVTHRVCENKTLFCGLIPFACGVAQVGCHNENAINDAWQRLVNNITDLQKLKNNLEGDLHTATIQKAAALEKIALGTAVKSQAELNRATTQVEYEVAEKTFAIAQQGLTEARELAKRLPTLPSLPKPGQLKIDHVQLLANGYEIASFDVNDRLQQGHPTWSRLIQPLSPERQFAEHLRVNLNKASSWTDEKASLATTVFKVTGVSGWEGASVDHARVIGTLLNPPSAGSDGFVSLDLQVERVEARNHSFILDNRNGISHIRYIRIEYKHINANGADDDRYKNWGAGQRLAVEGPALRDTDRWGFTELHPTEAAQVTALRQDQTGATSPVRLFFRRVLSYLF